MQVRNEKILIVEDDLSLAKGLAHNLRYEGYEVLVALNGEQGLELAMSQRPDLIVLDLMLPDFSGLEVLQALRRAAMEAQVLILSARGLEEDKVQGLRMGADDYIAKPFALRELLARVEAALRRPRQARLAQIEQVLRFADVEVYLKQRRIIRQGRDVRLTPKEFELLVFLLRHPGRVFEREQLLAQVWGYDYEGTARTVDNFVRSLRAKLEPCPGQPTYFETVHGVGYRFNEIATHS